MIKLINILKEIKVFKPFRSLSNMYNDVKPIIADYVNGYDIGIQKNKSSFYGYQTNRLSNDIFIEAAFLNNLDSDLTNNLAFDLAEYDSHTEELGYLVDKEPTNDYYNRVANTFLLKFGLENGLVKFPFPDDDPDDFKFYNYLYNNGDMFNSSWITKMEEYRGQF